MNKKVKNESANVLKERFAKGQEFLSSFTAETIFDGVKNIVRQHIPKHAIPYLDSCTLYRLVINENKIREIYFVFGGILNGYEVELNARHLRITPRNPNDFNKSIYCCYTCDLTKD